MCCGAPVPPSPYAPSGSLLYAAPDPALRPAHGFLNPTLNIGANTATQTTSPWPVIAAFAALLTGGVALARYYDDRMAR